MIIKPHIKDNLFKRPDEGRFYFSNNVVSHIIGKIEENIRNENVWNNLQKICIS